jgi:hypothetical protein
LAGGQRGDRAEGAKEKNAEGEFFSTWPEVNAVTEPKEPRRKMPKAIFLKLSRQEECEGG